MAAKANSDVTTKAMTHRRDVLDWRIACQLNLMLVSWLSIPINVITLPGVTLKHRASHVNDCYEISCDLTRIFDWIGLCLSIFTKFVNKLNSHKRLYWFPLSFLEGWCLGQVREPIKTWCGSRLFSFTLQDWTFINIFFNFYLNNARVQMTIHRAKNK